MKAARSGHVDLVRNITFVGNCDGPDLLCDHPNGVLRTQLEQGTSPTGTFWPVVTNIRTGEPLSMTTLDRDAYRLEVYYAHHGYFDARFHGWEVVRREPVKRWPEWKVLGKRSGRIRRAGVVDVVGRVDPGQPSRVRTLEIFGGSRLNAVLINAVREKSPLTNGAIFDVGGVYYTADTAVARFQEQSYAYAKADVTIDAYPEEHEVDVVIGVEPGVSAGYGELRIHGLENVPEDKLRRLLPIPPDDPRDGFQLSKMEATRQALFALGTFSVASVEPDLSDPTDKTIDIDVRVTETRFRTARVGGGVEYDGTSLTPRLSTNFTHANLAKRLIRFEGSAWGGAAILLNQGLVSLNEVTADSAVPIFGGETSLKVPALFLRPLTLQARAAYTQDLQNSALLYRKPEADVSLAWNVTEFLTVATGPHFEQYDLLRFEDDANAKLASQAIFGENFDGDYLLATMDARFTWDWRDNPLQAKRGSFWQGQVRQAMPLGADRFLYTDLTAEVRGFYSFSTENALARVMGRRPTSTSYPFTIAGRVRGRYLQPWLTDRTDADGNTLQALPYPELVFMGGPSDLRGFRDQQMGPYSCLCAYTPGGTGSFSTSSGAGASVDRRYLSRGGAGGLLGSVELRREDVAFEGLSLVGFTDIGVLLDRSDLDGEVTGGGQTFNYPLVRWNVGTGLRYASPIGPIRIDLAARPTYPEDVGPYAAPGCAVVQEAGQGVVQTDARARPYALFTGVGDPVSKYQPKGFAVQLFFGIGEAF